jgi:DNA (cytosine-5)-methyltransferase 1
MPYIKEINTLLKPKTNAASPVALDLFAGCGGLALGFEAQGFRTIGYEMDTHAAATYSKNLGGNCIEAFLTTDSKYPETDIVIGGPPCQPFSVRGKQKGLGDERNGFPAFIAAVKKTRPKLWLFENVKGLLYKNRDYLDEVIQSLKGLGYSVQLNLVNAADYGVPQNRERVIAIGYRGADFNFPQKLGTRVTVGEALGKLALSEPANSRYLTPSMDKYVAKYEAASKCAVPRDLHMHLPARTLTCRNLSGSTSDMQRIRLPNGKRRQLTHKEAARLQSFPDWFKFTGNDSQVFNQIGNAVPPMLAYHVAGAVREYLNTSKSPKKIRKPNFVRTYNYQPQLNFNVPTAK